MHHKTQITKLKYADIKNEPCNRKNAFNFAHGKHELKFKNIPYNTRCLIVTYKINETLELATLKLKLNM